VGKVELGWWHARNCGSLKHVTRSRVSSPESIRWNSLVEFNLGIFKKD
jgi:hypothetical protein